MEELEKIPKEKRIYIDQSGINEYLQRDYARSIKGRKVFGEISGNQFARQSIISALFNGKFLSPMCFEGTCDTILFNTWLKEMLIPALTSGYVLILDNASFHKSIESQKLVESSGCKILFLPPYSPDLNPIEKYWANMKVKIRNLLPAETIFTNAMDKAVLSM